MSGTINRDIEPLDKKRGFPVYDRNPSIPAPASFGVRSRPLRLNSGNRVMIVGRDNGEVMAEGHAAFFEFKEVDETQFIKLYLAGIQQTAKLSAAGLKVFELVYHQMRASPHTDRIELNHYLVKKFSLTMNLRTYQRGLREMLEHSFLFRSTSADVYFVNVNFMFNGNRITLAKTYYIKGSAPQLALDLEEPAQALPSAE